MNKRNIWIGAAAVFLILGIVALMLVFNSKLARIVNNPAKDNILAPRFTSDAQSLYYFESSNNTLKRWNLNNNQIEPIVHFDNSNIDWIEYSSDNTFALVHRTDPKDGIQNQTWLVDLNAKKIIKELPANIANIAWRADSKKIVYHHVDFNGDTNDLVVADPDGSNSQIITPLTEDYYQFYWSGQDQIIYFPLTTEAAPVSILTININNKQPKFLAQNLYINNSSRLDDQSIFFELSTDNGATYKLYRYQIIENKFVFVDNSMMAYPMVKIDNESFIGLRQAKNNYSLVKFANNQVNKISLDLKDFKAIDNIFYKNKTIYLVADGRLYATNN